MQAIQGIIDSIGNAITTVKANQQILIEAELQNMQQKDQPLHILYKLVILMVLHCRILDYWKTWCWSILNLAESWSPPAPGRYTAQNLCLAELI